MDTNTLRTRYDRHIRMPEIGLEGQQKIRQSRVLMVGAGGLGCPALQYLAAMGVGTIGILDNDVVDISNLQRQVLYGPADLDKPKVLAARERLLQINPDIHIVPHFMKLSRHNALEIFQQYDIIVEGSDNFPTKFLCNDACVMLNKPLVYAAVNRFEGQLTVFNYQGGPTLRCLLPEPPDPLEAPSCSQVGVLGSLPGIIGCMQATEVIKLITGAGKMLSGEILYLNFLSLEVFLFPLERNAQTAQVEQLTDYTDFCVDTTHIQQIDPQTLGQWFDQSTDLVLLDVRDEVHTDFPAEWNALHIPLVQIPKRWSTIPQGKTIVVVCEYGMMSLSAIHYLKAHTPLQKLFSLKEGLAGWKLHARRE